MMFQINIHLCLYVRKLEKEKILSNRSINLSGELIEKEVLIHTNYEWKYSCSEKSGWDIEVKIFLISGYSWDQNPKISEENWDVDSPPVSFFSNMNQTSFSWRTKFFSYFENPFFSPRDPKKTFSWTVSIFFLLFFWKRESQIVNITLSLNDEYSFIKPFQFSRRKKYSPAQVLSVFRAFQLMFWALFLGVCSSSLPCSQQVFTFLRGDARSMPIFLRLSFNQYLVHHKENIKYSFIHGSLHHIFSPSLQKAYWQKNFLCCKNSE